MSLIRSAIIATVGIWGAAFAVTVSFGGAADPVLSETAFSRRIEAENSRRWVAAFDLEVTETEVRVIVEVDLVRSGTVTPLEIAARASEWERAVERLWSDRVAVDLGDGVPRPIRVDVEFEPPHPHHRVIVREHSVGNDVMRWTLRTSTYGAAHEVGHMFGAYDDYPGGGTRPGVGPVRDPESVMWSRPKQEGVYPRHFELVRTAVEEQVPHATPILVTLE